MVRFQICLCLSLILFIPASDAQERELPTFASELARDAAHAYDAQIRSARREYERSLAAARRSYIDSLKTALNVELKRGPDGLENAVKIKSEIELIEAEQAATERKDAAPSDPREKLKKDLTGTTWEWSTQKNQRIKLLGNGTAVRDAAGIQNESPIPWIPIDGDRVVFLFGEVAVDIVKFDTSRGQMEVFFGPRGNAKSSLTLKRIRD